MSLNGNNYINSACNLIFFAAIIDVLDGKVARKLGTSGDFGKQIDSLADLVSFCLAPSYLFFYYYNDLINLNFIALSILSSLTLVNGAIRLAKFNIYSEQSNTSYYTGLPTTANAIFICSLILYMHNINFFDMIDFSLLGSSKSFDVFSLLNYPLKMILFFNEYVVLLLYVLSSFLLISSIKYAKFPQLNFSINKINTFSLIGLLIFFIFLVLGIYTYKYDIVLLFFILVYILGGVFNYFYIKIVNKRM